jgi:hypothetical protein
MDTKNSLDSLIAAQTNDPAFVKENFGSLVQWYERSNIRKPSPSLKSLMETVR